MAVVTQDSPVSDSERSLFKRTVYPRDAEGMPKAPTLLVAVCVVGVLFALGLYRWYMESTAFVVGLDSFEPEFEIYWMSWLYAQAIIIPTVGVLGVAAIWFTRPSPEEVYAITPGDELGWFMMLFTILGVGAIVLVLILGVWVEADAAWHQVTIRDTDFTPTHIQLFYGLIPIMGVGVVVGGVWIHTRVPLFIGRLSIPLGIVACTPLLIMPNLGYNEWGHTFFYAEELFAAPVHYGFVVLGWGLFAITGFLMQCLDRVVILTKIVREGTKA